tara:strand:+ start:342 stop:533 length:192 start_codon:yes stop_codon:yes gene_type:complete
MIKRFAGEKFNLLNPFTYGNFGKVVDKTREGDEDIKYSDTPAGQIGRAANERNRRINELLQNY